MVPAGYALLMDRLQVEVHRVLRLLHTCICETIFTGRAVPFFRLRAPLMVALKSFVGDIRPGRRLGVKDMCCLTAMVRVNIFGQIWAIHRLEALLSDCMLCQSTVRHNGLPSPSAEQHNMGKCSI